MLQSIQLSHDKYVLLSLLPLTVMLVALFVGGQLAQIAFSYSAVLFIALYVLIGTQSDEQRHQTNSFKLLAAGLVVILGVAFALLWYFHLQDPTYADPTYWLGFPRATAIVVYLLWMPPALYLMFSYPYFFEKYVWNEEQATAFREKSRVTPEDAATASGGDD